VYVRYVQIFVKSIFYTRDAQPFLGEGLLFLVHLRAEESSIKNDLKNLTSVFLACGFLLLPSELFWIVISCTFLSSSVKLKFTHKFSVIQEKSLVLFNLFRGLEYRLWSSLDLIIATQSPLTSLHPPSNYLITVLHCAAKLIKNLTPHDHVTSTLSELNSLPIQARVHFKICLLMYRVHTNSSASYVSSLVTPCSSLQSRRALRSSSQADFVFAQSIRKFENLAFELARRLNGTSCQTSFVNLHHNRYLKLTSRHICLRFIMTRFSHVTHFCARYAINNSLIMMIIIIKVFFTS